MIIPIPPKRKYQRSSRLHQAMALSGIRPRYLVQLANNLSVKLHSANFAMTTLKGSTANTSCVVTSNAIIQLIAKFGYAKTTRWQTDVVLPYLFPAAKHVATVRCTVPTTTQLRTLDVRISSPTRISVVTEKPTKDEVAWEVETSHL